MPNVVKQKRCPYHGGYIERECPACRFKRITGRDRENPRWTCCRRAMGREPQAWEFMLWNGDMWNRFLEYLGLKRIPGRRHRPRSF